MMCLNSVSSGVVWDLDNNKDEGAMLLARTSYIFILYWLRKLDGKKNNNSNNKKSIYFRVNDVSQEKTA